MSLTKKEHFLLWTTILVSFVSLNYICNVFLKGWYGVYVYSTENYRQEKQRLKMNESDSSIAHPFFGLSKLDSEKIQSPITSEPLFHRISKTDELKPIKILVLGGSVASHMSSSDVIYKYDMLAQIINERFATKRFWVYNAAFGGGKQPQQYFKYQYLDLVGFKPDIIINLDGFNEISLSLEENFNLKNPAIFPRSYSKSVHATAVDRSCLRNSNALADLNTRLPFLELLSWIYIKNCHKKIQGGEEVPWWSHQLVEPDEDFVSKSIAIWEESSNKIFEAASSRGTDYIHVLQPNQYLEGSKLFSEEEVEHVLRLKTTYGYHINNHYKRLSFKKLKANNIRDQRYLFSDFKQTVYADRCCHFNELGMKMIIEDIIDSNADVFRKYLLNINNREKLD